MCRKNMRFGFVPIVVLLIAVTGLQVRAAEPSAAALLSAGEASLPCCDFEPTFTLALGDVPQQQSPDKDPSEQEQAPPLPTERSVIVPTYVFPEQVTGSANLVPAQPLPTLPPIEAQDGTKPPPPTTTEALQSASVNMAEQFAPSGFAPDPIVQKPPEAQGMAQSSPALVQGDEPPDPATASRPVSSAGAAAANVGPLAAPVNDSIYSPWTTLQGDTWYQYTGEATVGGLDPNLPCAGNAPHYYTVWYGFTPTDSAWFQIDTFGSDYDTVLGIWTGSPGSMYNVACSDDFSGAQSRVFTRLTGGVFYYIEIAGFFSTSYGSLQLNVSNQLPAPNDSIYSYWNIGSLPFYTENAVEEATESTIDPYFSCVAGTRYDTVWYRLQSPFTGQLRLNTFGSNYDTVLAVYTGSPGALTSRACNDDASGTPQSQVTVNVTTGIWYYIEVASYYSGGGNDLRLYVEDIIFTDGFESGNLSLWPTRVTDSNDLRALFSTALAGNYLMQSLIDSNGAIYVQDPKPNNITNYHAAFWFDPNSISMAHNNAHTIFEGLNAANTQVMRVEFDYWNGNYELRAGLRGDNGVWYNTTWWIISDSPHYVEIYWRALLNGGISLYIDGSLKAEINTIDNDAKRIESVRLGAVRGVDSATRGRTRFDAFYSRRYGYIGVTSLAAAAVMVDTSYERPSSSTMQGQPVEPIILPTTIPVIVDGQTRTLRTVESDSRHVVRTTGWVAQTTPAIASGGAYLVNTSANDTLTLAFRGNALEIAYLSAPSFGSFAVEVDGVEVQRVSTATDTALQRIILPELARGAHSVTIRPLEGVVAIDAFYVVELREPATVPTELPTEVPTEMPTELPTEIPTEMPTELPTEIPTEVPTELPTEIPTEVPTEVPTEIPTEVPTEVQPTESPTEVPTELPVDLPTPVTETPAEVQADEPTEAAVEEADAAPAAEVTEASQ